MGNRCAFIKPAKTKYIENLPKDLSNTSAIFYIDEDYYNDNINEPQLFKNFTNGTIILSGILTKDNLRPVISSEFIFENCNCNIIIQTIEFNNSNNFDNDGNNIHVNSYKEYKYVSNLNIINCQNVVLNDISTVGHNYRNTDITSDWYRPALYANESTLFTLYNDIFIYNSTVDIINNITFRNSGIGLYATTNSNIAIQGTIHFTNDIRVNGSIQQHNLTFKKRQLATFATKNSKISITTEIFDNTNLYYGENYINDSGELLPELGFELPVYDTDVLSGNTIFDNNTTIKNRILRTNSVPIIFGLTDFGSIFNHNHTKLQPNADVRFDNLSGNLPNGAIYFQGINSNTTSISELSNNWDNYFNIKRNDKYDIIPANNNDVNTSKIIKNTTNSDNYLFLLSGNSYTITNYVDIYNIYQNLNQNSSETEFSLPEFNISANNNVNVIPVIKNFDYYAVRNKTSLKNE